MRLFNITKEIETLQEVRKLSEHTAQFTVVTGRRRIGKTSLIWKVYENEIDIVAEKELDNEAVFFEVKRKAENIDCDILIGKAQAFLKSTGKFKDYKLTYKGLSMQDM